MAKLLQTLVLFILLFVSFQSAHAQRCVDCGDKKKVELSVFPNPAIDFISLSDEDGIVKDIVIYNLAGRKMSTFPIYADVKYPVSDLSVGMYLIQFLDKEGKIITTQRLSKR